MTEKEKEAIKILNAQLNTITQDGYYKPMEEEATQTVLNLLEKQQKELDTLKEIEKSHKEENGKLRVELAKQKETNKAFHHFITFNGGKDIEDVTATKYMEIRREGYFEGRQDAQQKVEKLQNELEQKEQIIKRLEQDVEGYRDLSKQIQEEYSKQIREYEEGHNE